VQRKIYELKLKQQDDGENHTSSFKLYIPYLVLASVNQGKL